MIHPVLQAAVGTDVVVSFRGPRPDRIVVDGMTVVSNVVQRAAGRLDLMVRADVVEALVVSTDGSTAIIPVGLVLGLEPDR